MQFSTFQKNLDNWQGASLIFGVLEEEIASQLENIKFVVDPKLLLKKVNSFFKSMFLVLAEFGKGASYALKS